jgi:hypothetical protein
MKKADLAQWCGTMGTTDCQKCPDYDTCDNCGRRVCKYVSVDVNDSEELWCRYCAREHGFSKSEIESGTINFFD